MSGRRCLAALALLAGAHALSANVVVAQTEAPAARDDQAPHPLHLLVSVAPEQLDAGALRLRLEAELGQAVVMGADDVPRLEVATAEGELRLVHIDAEGNALRRATAMPDDPREVLLVATLLGASLVRDESAGLLDSLLPPPEDAPEQTETEPSTPETQSGEAEPQTEGEAEADPEAEPEPEPERDTPAAAPDAEPQPATTRPYESVGVDLLPGLGLSSRYGGTERRGFSLGIVADLYGAVDGYALGLLGSLGGEVDGVQQSFGVSAAGEVRGTQLGLINVSAESVDGAQVGAVNISGGPVRGAQVGILNVGESAEVGIGLFNFYARGETHLELQGDSSGLFRFAVKHGAGWWHSIYSIGANPFFDQVALLAGVGFGARVELADVAFLDLDVVGHYVFDARFLGGISFLTTGQILAGIRPIDEFAIVFGFGMNFFVNDVPETPTYTPYLDVAITDTATFWPSLNLGIQAL